MTIEEARAAAQTTVVETTSPDETADFAHALAEVAAPGDRIALSGPLGAGKTVFAKGFARGLGVRDVVNSPSFTLMAEYEGRLPLFHQDLYRLSGAEDAIAGGLLDDRQGEGVTLTEWADRLPSELDPARLTISIDVLDGDRRRLSVHGSSEHQQRYADAASRWRDAPRGARGMTGRLLLVVDTATRHPTLALAEPDGIVRAARQWESRHRHGERLLEELDALLAELSSEPKDLAGIVVGTGPGSFTGLRIGLAMVKVVAYSLELPIVGIPTTVALALAAARRTDGPVDAVVTLPAGASDRYVARFTVHGKTFEETAPASLVARPVEADKDGGSGLLVAVDFGVGAVPLEAADLGRKAVAGLAGALAAEGARRLASGLTDDVAALVPAYVALPRGIAQAAQEMTWSPDLR